MEGRSPHERSRQEIDIGDSNLRNLQSNSHQSYNWRSLGIHIGAVLLPQPEPVFKQHRVTVSTLKGEIVTHVAWPGAQVNANPAGLPGGVSIGIHGLWESPLPGQEVALGFIEGDVNNPIVLNKYPYNGTHRIDLEILHYLPLTKQLHGPTDVVLGHHTGSFVALRGTVPLPAQIEIRSPSSILVNTLGFYSANVGGFHSTIVGGAHTLTVGGASTITAGAAVAISAGAGATLTAGAAIAITAGAAVSVSAVGACTINATGIVSANAGGAISLTAGAAVTITAAGIITLSTVGGVVVNLGSRPVAALGDLVPTSIGPMPIAATGTFLRVP